MIKKIVLLLTLSTFIISCNDNLDIIQDGELNNQTLFTSIDNMQLVLNEVYDQMDTRNELLVSSQLTDEVALGDAGFPSITHSFQIFSNNGFASAIWTQKYRAINRANRLIEGAALYTPTAAEQETYNSIIAQARAIRAFCHFQLLVYFSTDMSDRNAPGVMKLDFVPSAQQLVPRATNGEVYDMIDADLQFAQTNLRTSTSGPLSWYFMNRNVVNAIRARMHLYRKEYAAAEAAADLLINGSGISLASCSFTLPTNFPMATNVTSHIGAAGASSFDTAPPSSSTIQFALFQMDRHVAPTTSPAYRRMWVDAIQGEAIFSLARLNNSNSFSSAYNTNQSYTGGAPLWDMGRNLYNSYTQPLGGGAQDFRRWSFVDRSATILADPNLATRVNEVIVIDKYPGKSGGHAANDIKVFRMSEMHLIKAECRVQAGDLAGAAIQIQRLRQARNYIPNAVVPTPVYANATAAYADILLERNKELCFEGHRYIDLKRIGSLAGVTSTNRFVKDSENSAAISPANISITDHRFTLPIPLDEINVNPMAQNPNY